MYYTVHSITQAVYRKGRMVKTMERLKRRLRRNKVARDPALYKIAVLIQDGRYYKEIRK